MSSSSLGGGIKNVVEDTTPQLGGNLDTNGKNIDSVTPTEVGYVSGVTSAIQTQLDAKTTASSTDTFTNKTIDANGTGNSISNIDVADLADGTDGELITWDAAGAPATVAAGTANQVLTSNGAGAAPTFQDAAGGGGSPSYVEYATLFETSGRFSTGGSGSTTFDTDGLKIQSGTANPSDERLIIGASSNYGTFDVFSNSYFNAHVSTFNTAATGAGEFFIGIFCAGSNMVTAGNINYVRDQYGFKWSKSGGTTTIYATNSQGTTETATSTSITPGNFITTLILAINSGSDIKFYVDNSLKATHTTNLPNAATVTQGPGFLQSSNENTTDDNVFYVRSFKAGVGNAG